MKQVVTCQEMKSCDSYTIERMGVPSCVLMERAALKVVEELEKRFTTENIKQKILCVCGSGNNGGDGVAIAENPASARLSERNLSGRKSGSQDGRNAAAVPDCRKLSGVCCE